MLFRFLFLLGALLWLPFAQVFGQEAPAATTISGGGLNTAIRLPAVDADAFQRRFGKPPILEETPPVQAPLYRVTTPYWRLVLQEDSEESEAVSLDAAYYPAGGYVRAERGGEDVWLVLDLRQRAILDRYIRLGERGLIGAEPGILELLVAAAAEETILVQIGSRVLTQDEAAQFWRLAAELRRQTLPNDPDGAEEGSVWLLFNLIEGRAVHVEYFVAEGVLLDNLKADAYTVPQLWLEPVLGEAAPRTGEPSEITGNAVPQESGRGSHLWWPVMVGGGLALVGAAALVRRCLSPAAVERR